MIVRRRDSAAPNLTPATGSHQKWLASPEYIAVMLCVPAESAAVEIVAFPDPSRFAIPRMAVPSANVTVPFDTGVTIAVRTTLLPYTDGSADDVKAKLVGALFTT
jgi:hypothetical protein